jgi:hypothetical protein
MCTMLHRNICIKIPSFYQNIAKTIKQKKYHIFMYTAKSLKDKKLYRIFIQQKFKIYFSMYLEL